MEPLHTDILIYGATPAGIAAACTAAKRGASVILAEPGKRIGGHVTSGICTTECEHMLPESFRGWMMKFLRIIGSYYSIDGPLHRWEPKIAERAFLQLVDDSAIHLITECPLIDVVKKQNTIVSILCGESVSIQAQVYIDASYEGDLLAQACVPYAVGRESIDTYNESLAGIRFIDRLEEVQNSKGHAERVDRIWNVPCTNSKGEYIQGVVPSCGLHERRGSGDGKVMNYHFRVTVTKNSKREPFLKPPAYNENRFELLSRHFHAHPETPLSMVVAFLDHPSGNYHLNSDMSTKVIPGDKWELNNLQGSIISLGHLGGQFEYPEADWATRRQIVDDHYDYNAGLLYYLSHSSLVPLSIRQEMQKWGLPTDEYVDNNHWPYQLYIRESRRMKGSYTLTQSDILENIMKEDVIFWNSHWIDSHHVQRLALDDQSFRNEGRIWKEVTKPYAIPYGSIIPKEEDCTNLIVPVCISSSHVAFSSIRLESTYMGLGEAAGEAGVLSLATSSVQRVDPKKIQSELGL